jgi:hypothetical protein
MFRFDQWYHIAATQQDKKVRIFKDGRYLEGMVSDFAIHDSKDWKLGDKDFAIECWFRKTFGIRNWSYAAKWSLANHIVW